MAEGGKRRGAWDLIEDAIAENDAERAGELSGDELAAEMKKAGLDPARARALTDKALAAAPAAAPPRRGSAWGLIESAIGEHDAEAAAKEAGKVVSLEERRKEEQAPRRGSAWSLIEDAIAEHEVERVGELSGEELAAEMKKAGLDPARARALTDKALAAAGASAEPSKVVSLDAQRRRRWTRASLWLVAASFAGYAAITLGGPGGVGTGDTRTEAEIRAADLREEAYAACAKGDALVCKGKLDEAKKLDPKGEQKSDVLGARARIEELEKGRKE
jgi:hypothetical protein